MLRLEALIAVVFLAVAATASAQTDQGGADASAATENAATEVDAEPAEAGQVIVRVEVAGDLASLGDSQTVRLHVVAPPHDVVATSSQTLDAEGHATFVVDVRDGAEAVAELQQEQRLFSDPVPLDTAGQRTATIALMSTTKDTSVLYAEHVYAILELWEGYITVTQAWNLNVRGDVVFASGTMPDGRPDFATLAMFPLPDEAEGVNVIRPEGQARVTGTRVAASLEISPRRPGERRGADVVVQYSIPSEHESLVEWTQELAMDVEEFAIVVPQESGHAKHPVLDIEIISDGCDDDSFVCFRPTDDNHDIPLRSDMQARVVRGSGSAGQTVRVATTGWPARVQWGRQAASVGTVLAILAAILLFVRDRRMRPDDPRQIRMAALEAQREALFDAAAELDRGLDDGLVLEQDHEVQMERIRQQLGVVYRRIREIDAGTESEARR